MNKQITLQQAVEKVQDGMTIMFGGFLGNGSATQIIDAIVEKGVKDLTIIANDTAYDEVAHGKLVSNHQVKKAIVSHTGTNKQTALQKNEGTLIVEYVPQGTLAERIRAAGAGLGGVLTPTGLGTIMADGKEIIKVDGKGSKQRLVPISEQAIHELQLYFQERNLLPIPPEYQDYVFVSHRRKKPLTRVMVFYVIKDLVEKAGIKKTVSPHTFRHSFATSLLEGGANLRAIQAMLGHESIATTQIYTHIDTTHLREEILLHHPRNMTKLKMED